MAGWYFLVHCSALHQDLPTWDTGYLQLPILCGLEEHPVLQDFTLLSSQEKVPFPTSRIRHLLLAGEANIAPCILLSVEPEHMQTCPQGHTRNSYTSCFPLCFLSVERTQMHFCKLWTQMQTFICSLVEWSANNQDCAEILELREISTQLVSSGSLKSFLCPARPLRKERFQLGSSGVRCQTDRITLAWFPKHPYTECVVFNLFPSMGELLLVMKEPSCSFSFCIKETK